MKDELEQLLKSLHLKRIAELFDEECKSAEKQKLSYPTLKIHSGTGHTFPV